MLRGCAVVLALLLVAFPGRSGAQLRPTPSELRDAELRNALRLLESVGEAHSEDQQLEQARRADEAIRIFQRAGRDGVPVLRETLQKGHRNPAYLIIAASLLVLAERASGVEAALKALEPVEATLHPDLFYRFIHIAALTDSRQTGQVIDRLLDIPPMEIRLSELGDGAHSPALVGFALAAAGEDGKARVLDILSRPSSVSDVRWRNLMAALSHLPSPDVARRLEKALPKLKGESKRAAVWALGKIDDELSVGFLIRQYASDPDPVVRKEVIFSLGEMAHPSARETLVKALADPSVEVRNNAIGSLTASGLPDAGEIIGKQFLNEKSALVRPNYVEALIRLRPKGYRQLLDQGKRKWPSFAYYIDEKLKRDPGGNPPGPPVVMPELAGRVLQEPEWRQLLMEVEESRGLNLSANMKTIVLTASEADAAYLESILPLIASGITIDHYRAFEAYQQVYRLIRRKWRKDPRPLFDIPPVWYGNPGAGTPN